MTSFSPLKKCALKLFTLRPELWQFPVIVIIPAPPEISSIGGGGATGGQGTSNWVMNEVDRKEGRAKPFPGLGGTARQRQTEVKRC